MRVLLDTHMLLWALARPARLPTAARKQIEAADVYVSAASIWEISIKSSLGTIDISSADVLAAVAPAGFSMLAISGEHAAHVANLPALHKDPFDRILVAQALIEPMILLTNDDAMRPYGPFVVIAAA